MSSESPDMPEEDNPLRCPHCWRRDIQRSRSRGIKDAVARAFFSLVPFRCRACQRRFYRRVRETATDVETS